MDSDPAAGADEMVAQLRQLKQLFNHGLYSLSEFLALSEQIMENAT